MTTNTSKYIGEGNPLQAEIANIEMNIDLSQNRKMEVIYDSTPYLKGSMSTYQRDTCPVIFIVLCGS